MRKARLAHFLLKQLPNLTDKSNKSIMPNNVQ